jgi:uracil-DNA glycosylase family 4
MRKASLDLDPRRSLEAAIRFAVSSGAWVLPGSRRATGAKGTQTLPAEIGDAARDPGTTLAAIREDLGDCRRCRLWEGRTHIVFGVGNPRARLMFVGEGPGEEEDRRGEPFVGRAGQLLDRMIRALGLEREQVYIANVVKCRPPRNREPREDEAATCMPFLWRQVDAIRPRVICALGSQATGNLLGAQAAIGSLRGRPKLARGWLVLPTYHPAYLLRNPLAKRLAWQDLKMLRELLASAS